MAADLDPATAALGWALQSLSLPQREALWLGARPGLFLPPGFDLRAAQDFRPWVDALRLQGVACADPEPGDGTQGTPVPARPPPGLILLSPARQREAARAEAARALTALADDGLLLSAVANDAGAKAFESDLRQLCADIEVHSKHKCRVLLAQARSRDAERCAQWSHLDDARPLATEIATTQGVWSTPLLGAPGLFAVDRIDTGSALLIEHLPSTLSGAVADLGSGLGVLSAAALERCPGITSLDLFEASARAVALSRYNLRAAPVPVRVHWQDVTLGVDGRFDAILCNPPFHAGGRGLPAIGQAFIHAAADALNAGGEAWIVANAHLPYEAVLAARFGRVDTIAATPGFKLLRAAMSKS